MAEDFRAVAKAVLTQAWLAKTVKDVQRVLRKQRTGTRGHLCDPLIFTLDVITSLALGILGNLLTPAAAEALSRLRKITLEIIVKNLNRAGVDSLPSEPPNIPEIEQKLVELGVPPTLAPTISKETSKTVLDSFAHEASKVRTRMKHTKRSKHSLSTREHLQARRISEAGYTDPLEE